MTFDQYVAYIGTPQNLGRATNAGPRLDQSAFFRQAFEKSRLSDAQDAALKWLVAQPNGPAKMLAISEDWSSDCRRDVPTFARMAAETGMELRIFNRDGQAFSSANVPSLADAPDSNADIMAEFLNHKNGQTYQSIPVCVFYTRDLAYLYHFTEYPAIYDKDRVVNERIRAARPGESPEQTRARVDREFPEFQRSPFFRVWASATVDEIISALHRKAVLGVV
ncbi:MAG TPA: thioredoxin family protein [Chloroflexota bacterium]|nr:thioredoxin family protein [Chloroflexota bacterium]